MQIIDLQLLYVSYMINLLSRIITWSNLLLKLEMLAMGKVMKYTLSPGCQIA